VNNVSRPLRAPMVAAAALAVAAAAAAGSALPASARELTAASRTVNAAQWWLPALDVPAAWRAAPGEGKGVTVAVLSTGVDGSHPDLTGTVTNGPDFAKTGRRPGRPYWADEGTAVAGLIAGHGHGANGAAGITGIAPGARILSVQVTLEYNDPLDSDAAIAGRLPAAIAAGIRYAVGHGASVISLPLDPGTLSAAGKGNPAADGSAAERAAVAYAIAHDVLLVAPAGDNGAAGDAVNYPAAYPGVIAVGATARNGEPAPFTNTGSYVALTAPGANVPPTVPDVAGEASPSAGLTVAAPGGGYQTLASTDMSAALTAGVAALIRGRYPWLTRAEVSQAIEDGATAPDSAATSSGRTSSSTTPGSGHGALNAANALARAAAIAAAHPRPTAQAAPAPASAPATSAAIAPPAATAKPASSGGAARSILLDLLIVVCVLIAGLFCALAVTWLRRRIRSRRAADAARAGRGRSPGRHSRALPPAPPAIQVAPDPGWPPTPPRAAIGAGSVWDNATPSARPTAGRAADAPLAPWEQSPSVFASAPVPKAPPPWPLSSTGPMYVWNPAATTGPLNTTAKKPSGPPEVDH
jgi:subtilisin family serine protease